MHVHEASFTKRLTKSKLRRSGRPSGATSQVVISEEETTLDGDHHRASRFLRRRLIVLAAGPVNGLR